MSTFKVAIVQDSPVFLNLAASVEKAVALIAEAAREARLVCFPETWLPGYPVWLDLAPGAGLWDYGPAKSTFHLLYDNSIQLEDEYVQRLAQAAAENDCFVAIGAHERFKGTLYNTILYLNASGELAGIHRKLMPTYTERLIWGRGDGSTLTVIDSDIGRVGGLICWEHWMPLARAAMHAKEELIHIAQWPMVKEMNLVASRHYAFEGQCYVLAAGAVLTRGEMFEGLPKHPATEGAKALLEEIPGANDDLLLRGGSAIIAPDGKLLAGPVDAKREILVAEVEPQAVAEARLFLDTDGHYARPDLFELSVNERQQIGVKFDKK